MLYRVYLSGPISRGDIHHNVNIARAAMKRLMRAGFSCLAPQLACYLDGDEPKAGSGGFTHEEWVTRDIAWVDVSDAVLRLSGVSIGADMETDHAEQNGIPVFYSVDSLIAYFGKLDARKKRREEMLLAIEVEYPLNV